MDHRVHVFIISSNNYVPTYRYLYAFYLIVIVMLQVFVGVLITAFTENPFHPSVIFLACLFIIFFGAGIAHPQEFTCLLHGALYFVSIPMGFLYLVIYSFCNMNVISWGTREVPRKKTKKELAEEARTKKEEDEKKKNRSFFSR